MKLKNFLFRLVTLSLSAAFFFTAASCGDFMNKMDRGCNAAERELNSAFDKLIVKLQDTMKGVNFIIENFSELTNPINENGELVEGWVGDELEEVFVQPDCVTRLDTGYREENEKGKTFSDVAVITGAEGMDAFVQSLKAAGYDAYNDELNWNFYSTMLKVNKDKVCMALKKGEVYIVVAYFASEEDKPNAVFTISEYDTLVKDEPEETSEESSGETGEETSGENSSAE